MSKLDETFKTLDKQFSEIPQKVVFCKNCVVSNQRPRTKFNADGICSACQWAYEKDHTVDWEKRHSELIQLCDKYRSNDGSYDVIVPGSGGKDSAYVAHQLKYRYGMSPLCVTWSPFEFTDIGWVNLNNFIDSGFNNIIGQPDGKIHRKLSRLALELKGDAWEPFTYGQKAWAFHMASRFNVKLIIYGENGELEYGGAEKYKNSPKEGVEEWEYEYFKGSNVDDLAEEGLQRGYFKENELLKNTLQLYKAPNPDLIMKIGCEMHWYSYYHKWTPQEHYYYAYKHTNFLPNPEGRSEGTYTKYVSLDDMLDGIHWYLGYAKFGMCRASRDAQADIRRNHITRDEGVRLVKRYDGELPRRDLDFFLNYLDIEESFFWEIFDKYREISNVWHKKDGKWIMPYLPT